MPDEFSIEARSLQELGMKLRRAAERSRLEVDGSLVAVGEEIAALSKEIASEHSTSIPPTIKTQPLPGAVRITAGGEAAPVAALYEFGNKGAKRNAPTFRHPVWGRDVWVEQPRFRFFAPARAKLRHQTTKTLAAAWKRAMRNAGIRVED